MATNPPIGYGECVFDIPPPPRTLIVRPTGNKNLLLLLLIIVPVIVLVTGNGILAKSTKDSIVDASNMLKAWKLVTVTVDGDNVDLIFNNQGIPYLAQCYCPKNASCTCINTPRSIPAVADNIANKKPVVVNLWTVNRFPVLNGPVVSLKKFNIASLLTGIGFILLYIVAFVIKKEYLQVGGAGNYLWSDDVVLTCPFIVVAICNTIACVAAYLLLCIYVGVPVDQS